MSKKFSYAVVIGRFQPVHDGHIEMFKYAQSIANNVIVVVGSVGKPRDIKNPWTLSERAEMIRSSCEWDQPPCILGATDALYSNAQWARNVQEMVSEYTQGEPTALVGYKKDDSSFYLDMFPQWKFHQFGPIGPNWWKMYNSTDIRNIMFSHKTFEPDQYGLPAAVSRVRMPTDEWMRLVREYEYIKAYKKSWEAAPYAPTFVTADAVVTKSGHVLMVERGAAPGEGLFALPGGFVNQFESVEDAAIRELREETKLKVPEPVLRGSIKSREVFDNPFRSLRGRTITHAFHFDLGVGELDKVKGSDDAKKAMWIPFSQLDPNEIFEDHHSIIVKMVGL